MAGRILHIGTDTCHRLPVFENAGYRVECCVSLVAFREALEDGEAPDAVVMTETDRVSSREAVRLARAHAPIPLVLFRETQRNYGEDGFDLVVPILHPPGAWLSEIAVLIEKSRRLQAESAELSRRSKQLRAEAAEVRAKSRAERERAARECSRNAAPAKRPARDPKPGKESF